ncbi:MAG: isocitrate lyase/phosphoenolpyruvate mutase family protein, partial [Terriglobales bacterium]
FVPGLLDLASIGRLVGDLRCAMNILAGAGAPSVAELKRAGVRRISLGSGPMRAGLGALRRLAQELKKQGTYSGLSDAPSHAEMNRLMGSR